MPGRIEKEWLKVREDNLRDAPFDEIEECRRAFYLGAGAILRLLKHDLGSKFRGLFSPLVDETMAFCEEALKDQSPDDEVKLG